MHCGNYLYTGWFKSRWTVVKIGLWSIFFGRNGVYGPFFLEGTMTGDKYLEMFNSFAPAIID